MAYLSKEAARLKLQALEEALNLRQADIKKYTNYYEGNHKLQYASDQFREWFEGQFKGFADNWCAPVVDATVERLGFAGIRPRDANGVDPDLQRAWEENGAETDSRLGWTSSAITGRSFALVWGSEDGPTLSFEHPANCIVMYEPGSRRKREAAAKFWQDERYVYGNLYTADGIYKFVRPNVQANHDHDYAARERLAKQLWVPNGVSGWEPREVKHRGIDENGDEAKEPWPVPNPMGMVPMVEFQNRPQLNGEPLNEISGVCAMQDAINALWSYLFTAADFAALPQRVILGAQLPKLPVLDKDGKKIGEKPIDLPEANVRRILNLEGPDAKIGQWDSANLETFTGVIEKAVGHIANQTRTPIYYFASSIENISGDTLQALDAGLCSKVSDRQLYANDPLKDVFELISLALGDEQLAKAVRGGTIMWHDHEMRSDAQKMDKLVKMQTLGFPQEYIFEKYTGGDADEVKRIMEMREADKSDPTTTVGAQVHGLQTQAEEQGREQAAADAKSKTGGSDNGETGDTRAARKATAPSGG